jgi:protein-disulfide isomerase
MEIDMNRVQFLTKSTNVDNRVFLPRDSLQNTYAHSSQRTNFAKQALLISLIAIMFALSFTSSSLASSEAVKPGISNNKIAETDIVIGNKDAKVLFIEYSAPTCTHCRGYHLKIYPELKAKYIDTGKIAYVMREAVGNKQDFDASLLARCKGDKDSYLKLTEHLLLNQESWAYSKDYRAKLLEIAKQHGISEEQHNSCLKYHDYNSGILFEHVKLIGSDKDYIGTPSFYIDGILYQGEYTKKAISGFIESIFIMEELNNEVQRIKERM